MKIFSPLTLVVCCAFAALARAEDLPVVDVWPGAVPNADLITGPEKDLPPGKGLILPKQSFNVSHATLTVFQPKEMNSGVAILVCPGGGYRDLEMDKEGEEAARWLNTLGITAVVLKYRVHDPALKDPPAYTLALQDAQRALRIVRSKSKDWGIQEGKVGIMGFSAGANLSVMASTHFDQKTYPAVDALDSLGCRPDFAVVVYPGGLVTADSSGLSPEVGVTKATSQMFIVQAETDRVNSENSVWLFLALKRAGVPAELHVYAAGAHGFGVRPSPNPHGTWTDRCADWLVGQGILKR